MTTTTTKTTITVIITAIRINRINRINRYFTRTLCPFFSLLFLALPLWANKPATPQGPFSGQGHRFMVELMATGQEVIWGMEFTSPQQIIFTERQGKIFLLDLPSKRITQVTGLEKATQVANMDQGGLLDVKLHPQFAQNQLIFLTYAKQVEDEKYTTVLARAHLRDNQLQDFRELFQAVPANTTNHHFGSRMAIKGDELFFSVGDRGKRDSAQQLDNDWGKIHRIKLDGSIPESNPFYSTPGARKSIYSYGHRNPQGLAFHPKTKELWEHEHGPRGGDEINLIKKAANYGWPVISYGKEYWNPFKQVGEGTKKEGMEQPLKYYVPSIAPCGMAFYYGNAFPQWQGNLLLGSLAYNHLNHLAITENKITGEERMLKSLEERIREVLVGPDGHIYLSTDNGNILRLVPAESEM